MTTIIAPGEFNRRITLQSRSGVKDSFGQQALSWADVATLWARIEPVSGREAVIAGAINAEITHQIRIRHRLGVNASMRALYGSRVFNILAVVEPDMAHIALDLYCSEGLTQG